MQRPQSKKRHKILNRFSARSSSSRFSCSLQKTDAEPCEPQLENAIVGDNLWVLVPGTTRGDRHVVCRKDIGMNAEHFKGTWKILSGKLWQRLAKLLASDTQYQEAKERELVGRIMKRAQEKEQDAETTNPARTESVGCESCRH